MIINSERGQNLIEVVLAMSIISVFLVALVNLSASTIRRLTFAKNQMVARSLMEKDLESLRAYRDNTSWADFVSNCQSQIFFAPDPGFSVSRSCASDAETATVVSTITWSNGAHSVAATAVLSDKSQW